MMVAIFFTTQSWNAIPQAETGQHSSVPADDPGVLVGAVFPIGASCPQQEEVITCGPQIMKLELQEAKRKQRRSSTRCSAQSSWISTAV